MNKLGIIISKEYLTRVRNKKFILTTLLTPLGFLVFFFVIFLLMSNESDKVYRVVISDQSHTEIKMPDNSSKFSFLKSDDALDSLKAKCRRGEVDAILVLPNFAGVEVRNYTAYYYSDKTLDIEMESKLSNYLESSLRNYKMKLLSIDKDQLDKVDTRISIDPEPISDTTADRSEYTSKIATMLGGVMGYVIFFIIFLYGASVMRSVTDEKINRIVEVVISSVSPTELMLGKIIGVGLVGLTQLLIWFVLIPVVYFIGIKMSGIDLNDLQKLATQIPQDQMNKAEEIQFVMREIMHLNWYKILAVFILYFLGGYFIYAAMFAGIGAAVGDDLNESQSLTMFVSVPILLGMYAMFSCIREPDSGLAMFSSLFPLWSPIIMPALIPFDMPWWRLGLSLVLLFVFAYFIIFIAGRIFRTGILMYGKKATAREILRWMFTKS
ncbi:MAG: ABC transporter permease [Saprospiraceae bacterium]|nr:ABC transporter permease [Saprospiraceae bacterium]HMW37874.1 ABC transporter permease [Saprospiraceae bacterium]HMX87382.1 ABC transporter permease [Saprospiraceae bacterium]HMZ39209.1 ABC transporter permease [Saprospiraceae bacterium]HNA63492.1 ABC transporter permease [Saprospiraceae bacterium]